MATAALPNNKRPQGGKKIVMKLMEKKSNRMVTFSKRRSSIFGKASELSTLSGAHVAVMIFSPSGKIYSFGSPSVEAVVERYEAPLPTGGSSQQNRNPGGQCFRMVPAYPAERSRRLKTELKQTLESVESEKMKSQMLDMAWEREQALWWNKPIAEMNLTLCKLMEQKLMELKMKVEAEVKNKPHEGSGKVLVGHDFTSRWINFGATPSTYIIPGPNNAAVGSLIDFRSGMYGFGDSSTSNFVPVSSWSSTAGAVNPGFAPSNSSYGVGPSSHINFTG